MLKLWIEGGERRLEKWKFDENLNLSTSYTILRFLWTSFEFSRDRVNRKCLYFQGETINLI